MSTYVGAAIPETLDGWTFEIVRSLVEQCVFETDRFDFKEMLPHPKDQEGKGRLRRDTAAFANSAGGFLVFGVKNEKGLSTADRIVGMPRTLDFPEQFGNYPSGCEPSVDWSFKNNPLIALSTDRVIHVVHIPASTRRPHGVFEDERWWFCKRTNKGTEAMSHAELAAAFGATRDKVARLRLLIAEMEFIRDRAHEVNIIVQNGKCPGTMPAYDVSMIAALTLDTIGLFPTNGQSLVPEVREAIREFEAVRLDRWVGNTMTLPRVSELARRVLNGAERLLELLRRTEANAAR